MTLKLFLEKNPETSAKRELMEETGLTSDNLQYLGYYHESPSTIQYGLHCYIAYDCEKIADMELEESEAIDSVLVVKSPKDLPTSDYKDAITDMMIANYYLNESQM